MEKTLFEQIIDREIPADIVMEDDDMIVIHDINPQAPVHVLLIPKQCITHLNQLIDDHKDLIANMMLKIPEVVKVLGIEENFRLVVNNGSQAGQTVFHLHMHLLGGRPFQWPPG